MTEIGQISEFPERKSMLNGPWDFSNNRNDDYFKQKFQTIGGQVNVQLIATNVDQR